MRKRSSGRSAARGLPLTGSGRESSTRSSTTPVNQLERIPPIATWAGDCGDDKLAERSPSSRCRTASQGKVK